MHRRCPLLIIDRPVDDQNAVEVIDLMLNNASVETLKFHLDRIALGVLRRDADLRRALDVHCDLTKREAPFADDIALIADDSDLGIAQRGYRTVFIRLDHHEATRSADLRCSQADSATVNHDPCQQLDVFGEPAIEKINGLRCHPQNRIAKLTDLLEGIEAALFQHRIIESTRSHGAEN